MSRSLWQILAVPTVLALASTAGLVSALVADGWADVGSWLLLGGTAAVGLWCAWPRRP